MQSTVVRFQKFDERIPGVDCWIWTGASGKYGHGRFYFNGENVHAHRVSFLLSGKEIPDGKVLDHLCCNPSCVNPEHLEPVTRAENSRRADGYLKGWKRNVTHCPKGHEYTPENTRLVKMNSLCGVGRVCKKCNQEYRSSKRAKGVL